MKKENYKSFDYARRYDPVRSKCPVQEVNVDEENVVPKDSLLHTIYAPDPRTGLPTGDITYMVSDKVNPQVKQFILDNLMMDTSSAKTPSVPDGISDDALFELSRGHNESLADYVGRLNKEVDTFKFIQEKYVSTRSKEASVSSE